MSYMEVVDFSAPWLPDRSGLWTPQNIVINDSGLQGDALNVNAQASELSLGHVEHTLTSPVDLSTYTELRFWVKSSRIGQNFSDKPFYMRLVAQPAAPSADPEWYRIIPIQSQNSWDLVRLWIEDMPASLRSNLGTLRIEALTGAPSFSAQFFSMLACAPNAIMDTENALIDRYHNRFTVDAENGPTQVGALVRHSSTGVSAPSILITPVAVNEIVEREQRGREETDNYTFEGASRVRTLNSVRLRYALDVVASRRSEAAQALTQVIGDLFDSPILLVAGRRAPIRVYEPSAEIRTEFLSRSSTPVFISLDIPVDVVQRDFSVWAQPFLTIDASPPQTPSETVPVP